MSLRKNTKKRRETATGSRTQPPGPERNPLVSQAVVGALMQQEAGASLDMALTRTLKSADSLDAQARRAVVQDLHAINRHRSRLSWHLTRERSRVTPHHLFLAWSAFRSRAEPKGARYTDGDRDLLERLKGRAFDDPKIPEAIRVECPPAFEQLLRQSLGEDFAAEMKTALESPPTDLRVNLLKTTRDTARRRLKDEGLTTQPTPLSPWGLRAPQTANASVTAAFRDGLIEFQDEGSQLAALLCDARPGMQVLDFCAGTGGKALALAAAMGNRGHLVAADVSEVRLTRAKLRLKRAGAENAERRLLPKADDRAMKKLYTRFDRVFVDAPCSGTGSWRRNPDIRWSSQAANIDELTALQDAILVRASHFVKLGGILVYATCSLLRQENDERVKHFLGANPAFTLIDAREIWREVAKSDWPCGEESVLRLSPAKHGTDGFFAAVLKRATNSA